MKKSLLAASLLVLAALLVTFRNIQSGGQEAGSKRTGNMLQKSEGASPGKNVRRTRPQRLSLEDSLPPGSRVLRSAGPPQFVSVTLPSGIGIRAASVSVTEKGFSFKGPFKFSGNKSSILDSAHEGAVLLISRDWRSFKMIGNAPAKTPIKEAMLEEYSGKRRQTSGYQRSARGMAE
jgi:hypothetical protein